LIRLKKPNFSSGYLLSCNTCNVPGNENAFSMWMPKSATKIEVCEEQYTCNCGEGGVAGIARKLKFVWKQGSVPPQMMAEQHLPMCVLCDQDLKDFMGVKVPIAPRGGGARGVGGGRGGRGRWEGEEEEGRGGEGRGGDGTIAGGAEDGCSGERSCVPLYHCNESVLLIVHFKFFWSWSFVQQNTTSVFETKSL
jgi:hypothetical protein